MLLYYGNWDWALSVQKNYSSHNITYASNAKFAKPSKDTCWIKQVEIEADRRISG